MCELFAANLNHPQALNAQLSTFFGDALMHPHGWGLAVRNRDGSLSLVKEAVRATDSLLLSQIMREQVESPHVLAHIRYATAGRISYDNTHPFEGRDALGTTWAFVHNGSVFNQDLIEAYRPVAQGQSDSERVLLYLLDALRRGYQEAQGGARGAGALGLGRHGNAADNGAVFDVRFRALAGALGGLSAGNKLNVILDDGTFTYVHTNTEDATLFSKRTQDGVLFCTRPLDDRGWQPVPRCRLLAYREGRLVRVSPKVSSSYHFDQRQLDAFLLANAA